MPSCWKPLILLLFAGPSHLQGQVLLDNFNRPSSTTVGAPWAEVESLSNLNGVILANMLLLDGLLISGREWVSTNATPLYGTTFSANSCQLVWAFNIQQGYSDPSGFNSGNNGVAFVLGGTSSNLTLGQGYAVVLGQSGSTDALRLVRYNNGLDANLNLSNLISYSDFGNQYLAVRVVYTPATNLWQMFVTASISASFTNPLLAATPAGSAVDATYTSIALPYVACLWNHSAGISVSLFDNIHIPDACSILPVELLWFDARSRPTSVQLQWVTASEENNDFFTVDRSTDMEHFTMIGQLHSAGNSQTETSYVLDDPSPLGGVSYYQLRQTDLDGTSEVLGMVAVQRDPDPEYQVTALADGSLQIAGATTPARWTLMDPLGRTLASADSQEASVVPAPALRRAGGMALLLLVGQQGQVLFKVLAPEGRPVWVGTF